MRKESAKNIHFYYHFNVLKFEKCGKIRISNNVSILFSSKNLKGRRCDDVI